MPTHLVPAWRPRVVQFSCGFAVVGPRTRTKTGRPYAATKGKVRRHGGCASPHGQTFVFGVVTSSGALTKFYSSSRMSQRSFFLRQSTNTQICSSRLRAGRN